MLQITVRFTFHKK